LRNARTHLYALSLYQNVDTQVLSRWREAQRVNRSVPQAAMHHSSCMLPRDLTRF